MINVIEIVNGTTPDIAEALQKEGFYLWDTVSDEEGYREIWMRNCYPEMVRLEIQDLPYQEAVA